MTQRSIKPSLAEDLDTIKRQSEARMTQQSEKMGDKPKLPERMERAVQPTALEIPAEVQDPVDILWRLAAAGNPLLKSRS